MFTLIGALIGIVLDVTIILGIACCIIALPFAFVGWVISKIKN